MTNPAVPTEVKRLRGTLRKDRIPGELVPVARAPLDAPAPADLGDAGRAEWESTLVTCSWVALSDLGSLKILCMLVDRHARLVSAFKTEDVLLYTSTGYAYSNPLITAIDKVEGQIAKWTSLLGKTPSDRSRLGVAEVTQASTLDKLAARRAARPLEPGRRAKTGQPAAP